MDMQLWWETLALSGRKTRAEDQKDHLRVSVPQNNWSELGKAHTLPEGQFLLSVKQDNIFA